MCMMCEGFTLEEVLDHHLELIEQHGFMVTGVGDGDGAGDGEDAPWAYTVGLEDGTGHPELILAGPNVDDSARLLNEIGRAVLRGAHFAPGDTWRSSQGKVRFGAVDPIQFRLGTFNVWLNMVDSGRLECSGFDALQVFAPSSWFCECHQVCQPDLSRPESRVGIALRRPNRAARRARPR
jgi:hypothetical protein